MDIDVVIHDQLDRELEQSVAPPLGSLVADALAAGQRGRRRRRMAMFGGAALGLAAVVAGGAVLTSNLGGGSAGLYQPGAQVEAPTAAPSPVVAGGLTPEVIVARLSEMLPAGGRIEDVQTQADEYGAEVTFTYVVGAKRGMIAMGVLHGLDEARFVCHDAKKTSCKRTTADDGVIVRALNLDKGTVRVDAGFTWETIVYIEASTSVLSRKQAIAIASDHVWLVPADAAEVSDAARTVDPLKGS